MKKDKEEFIDEEIEETDIYSEQYVEEALESDEITPEEEGFMRGYSIA